MEKLSRTTNAGKNDDKDKTLTTGIDVEAPASIYDDSDTTLLISPHSLYEVETETGSQCGRSAVQAPINDCGRGIPVGPPGFGRFAAAEQERERQRSEASIKRINQWQSKCQDTLGILFAVKTIVIIVVFIIIRFMS